MNHITNFRVIPELKKYGFIVKEQEKTGESMKFALQKSSNKQKKILLSH